MTVVWSSPVRYAECDQQGIVFNAHYLTYADEACTAWLASSYPALREAGLDLRVKSSSLVWSAPAVFGDTVEVSVGPVEPGRTSFTLPLTVATGRGTVCEVRTTYVVVDDEARPVRVPEALTQRWSDMSVS